MTKKEQIKDVLKCIFNNYIAAFMTISSLMMIVAGIQTGLFVRLLIDVFWVWLVTEILYWIIGRVVKFIKREKGERR